MQSQRKKYIRCLKCHSLLNPKNLNKHQRKLHPEFSIQDLWNEYNVILDSERCFHISITGKQCNRLRFGKHPYCEDHLYKHGCIFCDEHGKNRCGKSIHKQGYCLDHYNLCFPNRTATSKPKSITQRKKFINYKEYISSPEWKIKANNARKRAGWKCQICNRSADEVILDVHHRTYERLGNEMDSDLTVLCRDCHSLFELNSKNRPTNQKY